MPVERQQLNSGATEENRTPDRQFKRLLLYQLSYRGIFSANVFGLPIMSFFLPHIVHTLYHENKNLSSRKFSNYYVLYIHTFNNQKNHAG